MSKAAAAPQQLPKIALITNDVIGEHMAGPGIRYWEFARALGQHFPVKLIVPPVVGMTSAPTADNFPASIHLCTHPQELRSVVEACDVIITLGVILFFYPFLAELNKPLVLDLYNPFLLENLQREAETDLAKQLTSYESFFEASHHLLRAGDFFICAAEKQRDYWLGMLSAAGRVNPYNYRDDATLRRLIDVVPFGLPPELPRHTQSVLKGVYKNIAPTDKVILWGGGIWNWFDAPTLIKAMAQIVKQRSDVKLFFMGTNRPNLDSSTSRAVDQVVDLSQELGLYNHYVFFNDWVPYHERQNYLLEADLGISLHLGYLETRFAFRTRLLDYLWAGLPAICTRGDVLGETLAEQGLVHLVAPQHVEEVTSAILSHLDNPTLRAEKAPRFAQAAADYRWDVVTRPLIQFCTAPYFASDKSYLQQLSTSSNLRPQSRSLLSKSWRALRLGGFSGLFRQSSEYIRWKISRFQKL